MEDLPKQSPEEKPEDDANKKKKRKKSARLRLPIPVSLEAEQKQKTSKQEKASPDEPVAEEAKAEPEKNEAVETPEGTTEPAVEAIATDVEQTEGTTEMVEDSGEMLAVEAEPDTEPYEQMKARELEPQEFSGGEVIINLKGDKPVIERVVPLQPEITSTTDASLEPGTYEPVPRAEQPEMPVVDRVANNPNVLPRQRDEVYYHAEEVTPAATSTEQVATKKDVDNAIYTATKAGQNRGLLAGGLIAGGYEHFKHKRRERVQQRRFDAQSKQLETAQQNYTFGAQEQASQQVRAEQRFTTLEQRLAATEQAQKPTPRPEAQQPTQIEQLAIPAEHRLETSAWHSIEVDAKTGKAVENPTFAYGHEYYRERAQESTPTAQRNAAAGEVALVAAATASTTPNNADGSVPPVNIPDASRQGPPPDNPKQRTKSTLASIAQVADDNGPLWPWITALVIVSICLFAVIF